MSCPVLLEPDCLVAKGLGTVVGAGASAAAGNVLGSIASSIQSGISWVVANSIDWWIKVPSPDLSAEPAVTHLQQLMLPVAAAVAVMGMIIAGAKMALTRKANPLVDVAAGLVTIGATTAIGVILPDLLLQAGDAWSNWILNASTGGQFAARLTDVLTLNGAQPAVVVVLGIVAIVFSALQAVLMLFRQASIVILAGVLPLAAAGTLTPATRPWFRSVTGWMSALIFYKPAAAAIDATAFTFIGTGRGARTIFMGFAMIGMSLLALPILMRFFTFTVGRVETAGGGGVMQTAMSGAVAFGALRGSAGGSGGASAADQARLMSDRLGSPGPAPSGAGPGGARAGGAAGRPASAVPGSEPGGGVPQGATAASNAGRASGGAHGAAWTGAVVSGPAGAAVTGAVTGAQATGRAAGDAMQPPAGSGGGWQ